MKNDARVRLHQATAAIYALIDELGDALAREHGWDNLSGDEAARYYLMKKHDWLPREVRTMGYEDLRFALHQELSTRKRT